MRFRKHPFYVGWTWAWLWSDVYRGIELHLGHRSLYLGWVNPLMRERGW